MFVSMAQYFRKVFCEHELIFEEASIDYIDSGATATKISVLCKKCAYHKAINKFKTG